MGVRKASGFCWACGLLSRWWWVALCGGVRDRIILLKSRAGDSAKIVRWERVDEVIEVV